jgi:nucleoside-diphosphate-sugar epimerase
MSYALDAKTVLITGATGFLGRHLTPSLLGQCGRLLALVRSPEKARGRLPADVEVYQGDMTEPSGWPDIFGETDAVVHLANIVDPSTGPVQEVNVEGTRHLARQAAEEGAERFLYVSSVMVYGLSAPPVVTEATEFGSDVNAYGRSKQEAEKLLLEMQGTGRLDPVIVEPAAIYGPHDETWTLGPLEIAREGAAILPDGGQGQFQPMNVEDLTGGLTAALRRGRPGERYILSGPAPVTFQEYFGQFTEMVGEGEPKSMPGWLMRSLAALMEWGAPLTGQEPILTQEEIRYLQRQSEYRHEKARKELGFEPEVSLEEGMRRVEHWLKEEGYLDASAAKQPS